MEHNNAGKFILEYHLMFAQPFNTLQNTHLFFIKTLDVQ